MSMNEDKRDLLLLAIIGGIILTLVLLTSGCAGTFPTPPAPPSYFGDPLVRLYCVYDPCRGRDKDACAAAVARNPDAQVGETCDVFRSSQPSDTDWSRLVAKYKIATEVKLNGLESRVKPPAGVVTIDRPLSVEMDGDDKDQLVALDKILDEIDAAKKPVLIHCTHGEDRTGLISALWELRHEKLGVFGSLDDVYGRMMRRGFHPYHGLFVAFSRWGGWPL